MILSDVGWWRFYFADKALDVRYSCMSLSWSKDCLFDIRVGAWVEEKTLFCYSCRSLVTSSSCCCVKVGRWRDPLQAAGMCWELLNGRSPRSSWGDVVFDGVTPGVCYFVEVTVEWAKNMEREKYFDKFTGGSIQDWLFVSLTLSNCPTLLGLDLQFVTVL